MLRKSVVNLSDAHSILAHGTEDQKRVMYNAMLLEIEGWRKAWREFQLSIPLKLESEEVFEGVKTSTHLGVKYQNMVYRVLVRVNRDGTPIIPNELKEEADAIVNLDEVAIANGRFWVKNRFEEDGEALFEEAARSCVIQDAQKLVDTWKAEQLTLKA
jgi:hypothetical protein